MRKKYDYQKLVKKTAIRLQQYWTDRLQQNLKAYEWLINPED